MSQILKLTHENQQLKRQISQYKQVLGVSPYVDDSLFKGGYRVVKTIEDRDAIKCCWRKQGMKVVVIGDNFSYKEYVLRSSDCKTNQWEEVQTQVTENDVILTEDYSELSEDLITQKDLNLILKQLILDLQTQIGNVELTDEKVQITETTNFAQIGQTQKDFNKNVSDYKGVVDSNIQGLQTALDGKLDKGTYTGNVSDLKTEIDSKLNKPTTTSNTTSYPYVVGEDGNGNSARLPAGDLGKNFFNSDLSNTTARNHTMNAGVTINTLGNPHTLSGLPNKNTDIANFRKVRVQNTSGLDSVVDSKNLLTDAMTSMSDAEKDAWRLAQRKTNETYSTGQPRVDLISPIIIDKSKDYIQYVTLIGLNLFVNPATSSLYIYKFAELDNSIITNPVMIQITNFENYQSKTSILTFGLNFKNFEDGIYKVKIINNGIESLQSSTFSIYNNSPVETIVSTEWDRDSRDSTYFDTVETTNGIDIYSKSAVNGETETLYYQSNNFITTSDINSGVVIKMSCLLEVCYNNLFKVGVAISDAQSFAENDYKNFGFVFDGSNILRYANNTTYSNVGSVGATVAAKKTISDNLIIVIRNNIISFYFENLGLISSTNLITNSPLKIALLTTGSATSAAIRQRIVLNNITKTLLS